MAAEYPQLVIFDCDGVLVDSEAISIAVLLDMVSAGGGNVSEAAAYQHFLGRSMASVGKILDAEFGFAVTDTHLDAMRCEIERRFIQDLKPMPGIFGALGAIDTARCVASSSQPDRIRLSLRLTGLLEMLEPAIYSASMVSVGKPAPDLFLHAAAAMGVPPSACVVIEDSPAGVEAAGRAGMRVLAFTGGSHALQASLHDALTALGPDAVFDDMARLPGLLCNMYPKARAS